MQYTWTEILLALAASVGGISGVIKFASFVSERFDKRRDRKEKQVASEVHFSIEGRRDAQAEVWRIVEELKREVADLEKENTELNELLDKSKLSRKVILQIYTNLRLMEEEIDRMNVMVFDQEKTNVFMQRFGNVKTKISETRELLP